MEALVITLPSKALGVTRFVAPGPLVVLQNLLLNFVTKPDFVGDDKALVGAVAFLDGQPVTVLADVKGKDFAECARRNYGMPMPEGYRKALRLMKQAEKFNRPIISFVNTPGAFCCILFCQCSRIREEL